MPQEVDTLCEEWEPEPLGKPLTAVRAGYVPPVITSPIGAFITVEGHEARVLNMASFNFIGTSGDPKILVRPLFAA